MGRVKVNRKLKVEGSRESLDEFALKWQLMAFNDSGCKSALSFVFEFMSFLNFLLTAVGSSYINLVT